MVSVAALLAALVFLGLFPPTALFSELWVKPLVALTAGVYLWRFQLWPWSVALLGFGLGDLSWGLMETQGGTNHPFWALPHLLGYAALTAAILHLPGKPPRYAFGLLPLTLGGLYGVVALSGIDRVLALWDVLLILLFLPKVERLLETGGLKEILTLMGVFLFLVADLAYVLLGEHPLGHPLHLLLTLSYLFWPLGQSPFPPQGFLGPGLVFLGVWAMPATFLGEPSSVGLRLLILYSTLVGGFGFLYANAIERGRIAEQQKRWGGFLERLNRLNPRVTQTLSPETLLLGALGQLKPFGRRRWASRCGPAGGWWGRGPPMRCPFP